MTMEPKKLNRIINLVREEMMGAGSLPTNHTGKAIQNFDPLLGKGKVEKRKKPKYLSLGPGSRKRWMKKSES